MGNFLIVKCRRWKFIPLIKSTIEIHPELRTSWNDLYNLALKIRDEYGATVYVARPRLDA